MHACGMCCQSLALTLACAVWRPSSALQVASETAGFGERRGRGDRGGRGGRGRGFGGRGGDRPERAERPFGGRGGAGRGPSGPGAAINVEDTSAFPSLG
jgi:hypothetical protein